MSLSSFYSVVPTPPIILSDSINSAGNNLELKINNIKKSYSPWKIAVKAATTEKIDFIGEKIIDGVQVNYGDRVLVKDQIRDIFSLDGYLDNGIYIVDTNWYRSYDYEIGNKVVGTIIFVQNGFMNGNRYFYCSNVSSIEDGKVVGFNDVVGTARINFLPLPGIPWGPTNSIQYNHPYGYFDGSEIFTYSVDENELRLGNDTYKVNLVFGGDSTIDKNVYIKTNDSDLVTGDILFKTGQRSLNSTDGLIDIASSMDRTLLDINQINIHTNIGGSVKFVSGGNGGSINISVPLADQEPDIVSHITFDSPDYINITTSNFPILIQNGGIKLSKPTTTIANLAASPISNYRQGFIDITNMSALAANSYVNLVVLCDKVQSNSLIFATVNQYVGLAKPIVEIIAKNTGVSFTLQISNMSASPGSSGVNLVIFYVIF